MSPPARFNVLVVANTAKDHLKMIESATPFFDRLAADSDFTVTFTDEPKAINEENLAQYQVFVQLQRAPFEMNPAQQAALQAFVESGKGWVGIHAAGLTGRLFQSTDTPYWQWFEDLLGGITYSPHPAFQKGTVIVEDRTHPATKNLPATFEVHDEWYEFNESPRGRVRVLATADESTYKQNKPMGDRARSRPL
jgi:type 1 glutamine amidotransferase